MTQALLAPEGTKVDGMKSGKCEGCGKPISYLKIELCFLCIDYTVKKGSTSKVRVREVSVPSDFFDGTD